MTTSGSNDADLTSPCICTAVKARSWINECPEVTKSEHCSTTARRAALYASEMISAKYLGRIKLGTLFLTLSQRSFNHWAGLARFGWVSA